MKSNHTQLQVQQPLAQVEAEVEVVAVLVAPALALAQVVEVVAEVVAAEVLRHRTDTADQPSQSDPGRIPHTKSHSQGNRGR